MTGTCWPLPLFSSSHTCLHASSGSSPSLDVFCFFPKVAVFCFFISQFLCSVLSVPTVRALPPPLCISPVSDGRRVVCDWGQVGLCIEGEGGLILSTSKVAADFLSFYSTWFQFVSVSCWAPGWVGGGWGMGARCQGRIRRSSERNIRLIVDSKLPLSLLTINTKLAVHFVLWILYSPNFIS